jgi:tRNA (guanosine-2'-O-)-methyltransferase
MDFRDLDQLIEAHGAARVVERVAPYLTAQRIERIETVLTGRLDSLHVAVERPEDPHNAAAIVRTAEALGALHVHAIEAPEGTLHAGSTTQGSYYWVHTYHHRAREPFLAQIRARGACLAGATMEGTQAVDELPSDRPLCLLFGNEKLGLSPDMLAACDLTFRIPMVGMSESLNLSVSAAIALYASSRARRARLEKPGDLAGPALELMRARYYARSLERRLLDGLFAS